MEQNKEESTVYFDELPLWSAPFGCKLLEEIQLKKNIKVLDIGFGTGFPLIELARRLGQYGVVYGLDPNEEAMNKTNRKVQHYDLKNVRTFVGVAEKMPFRDAYFDLIVSNNGLNNASDMKIALSETFRVAKPGAPLIFTANLPDTMIEFYEIFRSVLLAFGLKEENGRISKHIAERRKSVEELSSLVRNAGFEIQKIDEDKFHLDFIDGTTFLNHSFIRNAFLDSWKKIVSSSDVRRVMLQLEKNLNSYSDQNGSLKLTIPFACVCCTKP